MTWLRDKISSEIVEQLQNGSRPWVAGDDVLVGGARASMLACNPVSDRRYRGGNRLMLGMIANGMGYSDPRWMTMLQANQHFDARVRKGEKASYVEYWKWTKSVPTGEVDLVTQKPTFKQVKLSKPMVFWAKVFNASQFAGLPDLAEPETEIHPLDAAEALLQASGATISFGETTSPFYSPTRDEILMPAKETFANTEQYYSEVLRQLVRWTDKEARSPRRLEEFAREDLVSELGAVMLCAELGIRYQNATDDGPGGKVEQWIAGIEEDKHLFFRAAAMAETASNFLMQYTNGMEYRPLDTADLSDISFDMDEIADALDDEPSMAMG